VLRHIDVFIGVAIVMLAVSLLLTIVTQMISFLANFRGKQLQKGLGELFKELGVGGDADELARKILLHPLIADGLGAKRVAPAISKLDLTALIEEADTLLAHAVHVSKVDVAALKNAAGQVEKWFDATMSRVSNRFAMQARLVTIVCALVAAFALQLDAFGLVTRLYADSDLRTKLAGAAEGMLTESQRILKTSTAFPDAATGLAQIKQATGELKTISDTLGSTGFQLVPTPYRPFHCGSFLVFLGVLTSAGLLSLGAPFWFNMLKTATNLRPAMATAVQNRDDASKK
jgi:hypothetical protein